MAEFSNLYWFELDLADSVGRFHLSETDPVSDLVDFECNRDVSAPG